MSNYFEPNGDEKEPDIDDEAEARQREIARRCCTDGFCGAFDCVRCRGSAALDEIFREEEE